MPFTQAQANAAAAHMARILAAAVDANETAVAGAGDLLEDVLWDLRDVIASLPSSSWRRAVALPKLEGVIAATLDRIGGDVHGAIMDGLDAGVTAATRAVVIPLVDEHIISAVLAEEFGTIPSAFLNIAADFSAEFVQQLTADMRKDLGGYVARLFTGGVSQIDAIHELAGVLQGLGATPLNFGTFVRRAEAIYRTETLRMLSMATEVRGVQANAMWPPGTMLKWWGWSHRPITGRPDHEAIELATKSSPIPFEDDFIVGGERAKYPRMPGLSAKQSVNCACNVRHLLRATAVEPRSPMPVTQALEYVGPEFDRFVASFAEAA